MPRASIAVLILAVLPSACARPVQETGSLPAPAASLQVLTGDWAGSYRALAETGRSGSLFLRIQVDGDEGIGRAIMNVGDRETAVIPRRGDPFDCPPERLQFVTFRVGPEGTLVGISERYADPVTGALVRTVYTGRLVGTAFEGSYVTENVRSGQRTHGRWQVVRRGAMS